MKMASGCTAERTGHAPDRSAVPDGISGTVYRFRSRGTPLRRPPAWREEKRRPAIGSPHHMGAEQAKCQMYGAAGGYDGQTSLLLSLSD
jgi:hypothetical protein